MTSSASRWLLRVILGVLLGTLMFALSLLVQVWLAGGF